jgi:hypothetical protein
MLRLFKAVVKKGQQFPQEVANRAWWGDFVATVQELEQTYSAS